LLGSNGSDPAGCALILYVDIGIPLVPVPHIYANNLSGSCITDSYTGSSSTTAVSRTALAAHASNVNHSNTTYSAGTGLTLSGTTFNVDSHNHSGVYATASHNHSGVYDNYGTWTFRTDSGSGNDEAVEGGTITHFLGGEGIEVTNSGHVITIELDNGGGGSGTINSGSSSRLAYYTGATTLDDTAYYATHNQIGSAASSVYLFYTDNADIGFMV